MASWGGTVPKAKRQGLMIHFDASTSDAGGIAWLKDPRCKVSYNYAVRDNGEVVPIAPENMRAFHAGVCKPSMPELVYTDANSAFYGIALTATSGDTVTQAAYDAIVVLCKRLYAKHGWTEPWRITGHSAEAVYPPGHPKAGQRGRKWDPEGPDPSRPVLSVDKVRRLVCNADQG